MKFVQLLMRRAWPAAFLGLALALTSVPGCSGGSGDVAGVNPYSVLPAEEVEQGKKAFLNKMYPDKPPPKAPGVKPGPTPKAK